MFLSRGARIFWSILISTVLTQIPNMAWADAAQLGMIPASAVIDEMNRAQAQEKIETFLGRADVRDGLMKRGVSLEEAQMRIAGLSERELKQLANQMDQARAGGDVFGILILVLIVLGIIYLVKLI